MIIHTDWYNDGIEGGRDLWRMDLPDVQIQVSLDVVNAEDERDGEAPEYGTKAELFIEHDVRGGGPDGDDRTKYSADDFNASREEVVALLAMSRSDVEKRLGSEIRRVKLMPSDPAYCVIDKPRPARIAPTPSPDVIERGQREWMKRFANYEFNKEIQASRTRLNEAAPALLKSCKELLSLINEHLPNNSTQVQDAVRAVIKAEGRAQ